jgi:hypothetical protein
MLRSKLGKIVGSRSRTRTVPLCDNNRIAAGATKVGSWRRLEPNLKPQHLRHFSNSPTGSPRPDRNNPRKNANALIGDSKAFLTKGRNLPFKQWSSNNFRLFNEWQHLLFTIPYTDRQLLEQCAVCVDSLVRAFFDKYTSQSLTDKAETIRMMAGATDFVCAGIYSWGRVAANDLEAPSKAESLLWKLEQAYKDSSHEPAFRPTEEVYSALTYCWSQATGHPKAPEKAHHWLKVILDNPGMNVRAPAYNAVTRAYAKQGRVEDVQRLVETMPMAKNAYTYESIIQSWLYSGRQQAPQEAYQALQQGLQQGLLQGNDENMDALAQLFGRFLNMNRDNPKVCQQILNQLQSLQQDYPSFELLQPRHFVIVMTSWVKAGEPEKVEKLFVVMQNLYENGKQQFRPTYQVRFVCK